MRKWTSLFPPNKTKKDHHLILLSFDTEEFDVPREHGVDFSLEQGMAVSKVGTNRILDVLKKNGIGVTMRRELGASVNAACGQLSADRERS